MSDIGDSDGASDVGVQSRRRESHSQSTVQTSSDNIRRRRGSVIASQADGGVGHRVKASRSVLALVLDDECVFAGLQGGDIVVSNMTLVLLFSSSTGS